MKKSNTLTLLILLTFTIIACSAQSSISNSQAVNDWELLGSRTVSINTDHDEISVSANKGTFRKLKFKVTRASIFVKNVRIIYGNGESENHKVNRAFKKEHFTIWTSYLFEIIDANFNGEIANNMKNKARSIATVMQLKMNLYKD